MQDESNESYEAFADRAEAVIGHWRYALELLTAETGSLIAQADDVLEKIRRARVGEPMVLRGTNVYHRSMACPFAREGMKQVPLSEVTKAGYRACRECKP